MINTIKRFYKDTNKKLKSRNVFEYSRLYIRILQFRLSLFCLRHLSNKEVQQLNHDEEDVILSDSEDKLHDVKIKPTIQEVKHQDE